MVLAFGALTVLGRERWSRLGLRESMVARVAAAFVLASIGLGGANVLIVLVMTSFRGQLTDLRFVDQRSLETARTQTLIGLPLALVVATGLVLRIEMYHRRAVGTASKEEGEEWVQEPTAVAAPQAATGQPSAAGHR